MSRKAAGQQGSLVPPPDQPYCYYGVFPAGYPARCTLAAAESFSSSADEWSSRSASTWDSSDSDVGSDASRAGRDRSNVLSYVNDKHVHENHGYRHSSPEHENAQLAPKLQP
jgi:hypothetical protein